MHAFADICVSDVECIEAPSGLIPQLNIARPLDITESVNRFQLQKRPSAQGCNDRQQRT